MDIQKNLYMQFKKLEIQSEKRSFKEIIGSKNFIKSVISIFIGAAAGFAYYYFTEGQGLDTLVFSDFIGNILAGGFLGFFISNSPCANNKC